MWWHVDFQHHSIKIIFKKYLIGEIKIEIEITFFPVRFPDRKNRKTDLSEKRCDLLKSFYIAKVETHSHITIPMIKVHKVLHLGSLFIIEELYKCYCHDPRSLSL